MKQAAVTADGEAITVYIPMAFRKRGGRKLVVTPDGAPWAPRPRVDNTMVKALARAFRWRNMLDEGVCGTIEELAKRERVNRGYMSRVLRLTLLAPEIVEAILDGRQPVALQLDDLLKGVPLEWAAQQSAMLSLHERGILVPSLREPTGRRMCAHSKTAAARQSTPPPSMPSRLASPGE